jgi:hypothetical protein
MLASGVGRAMQPSRKIQPGDTVFVRATALEVGTDFLQAVVDDGFQLAVTIWLPSRECARPEDIGELPPPRKANPRHIER